MYNYILPGCERSKNYKPLLKTGIEIIQGLTKLTYLSVSLENSDGLFSVALASMECRWNFMLRSLSETVPT